LVSAIATAILCKLFALGSCLWYYFIPWDFAQYGSQCIQAA